MASIRYDKIPLIIEYGARTEKILAYDCSLSQAADLQPVKAIGFHGVAEQTPQGARTSSISFSYTPVLTGIVNTKYGSTGSFNTINEIASGLKNSKKSQTSGVMIKFGGISGEGLLSQYSLSMQPYSPVTCNVNFELFGTGTYVPISGELQESVIPKKDQDLANSVGHSAYSAFMTANSPATITSDSQTGVLQSVEYNINFAYQPVYKLGQEFPSSFLYHSAVEEASITENVFETGIAFTGKAENFKLNVKSLDNNNAMVIEMNRPVLSNNQLSVNATQIADSNKTIRSFY
tara:strand:+ start:18574 stop:19446 length:873 start_codon:yes stop_codon:yes gene_type:complete